LHWSITIRDGRSDGALVAGDAGTGDRDISATGTGEFRSFDGSVSGHHEDGNSVFA
jgi:hypothetical protein